MSQYNTTSNVAVASRSFSNNPQLRKELLERYENVTFNNSGFSLSGSELVKFLQGHDKAITALEIIDDNLLMHLPKLKVISKYGVGLDMIDLDAMDRYDVQLGWTGGVNKRSVAEMVIASAISLLHRVPESQSIIRSNKWEQIQGCQLTNQTVGIVGYGNIGKDVASLLLVFGCKILVYDITKYHAHYQNNKIIPVSLEDLLKESKIITIHLPLNSSTRGMFNEHCINRMQKKSCLINMSRGGIVDENALKKRLKDGTLSGAALDVFQQEPPSDLELLSLSTLIATTHIGGSTEEAVLAMGRAAIQGLDSACQAGIYKSYNL